MEYLSHTQYYFNQQIGQRSSLLNLLLPLDLRYLKAISYSIITYQILAKRIRKKERKKNPLRISIIEPEMGIREWTKTKMSEEFNNSWRRRVSRRQYHFFNGLKRLDIWQKMKTVSKDMIEGTLILKKIK